MSPVLGITDLHLGFKGYTGYSEVLHGITLSVNSAERVALVGESGSGKSVTARIVLGLLQQERGVRISGQLSFLQHNLNSLNAGQWRDLRGTQISMIFQDPTSALNPVFTIGMQFTEVLRRSTPQLTERQALNKAAELLQSVSITDAARVLEAYPFQLSGGMNQRVVIAMALSNNPALLIADEPGTALDVTVQAQTLNLMNRLVASHNTALLFISHNLGVVREFADRIYVIYRGRIVEHGPTAAVFAHPGHPYTRALMAAVPRLTGGGIANIPDTSDDFLQPCVDHGSAI